MPSILNATTTNGLVTSADNSGSLQLQTNNGTTAVTIDTSQRAAFVAGTAALPAITTSGDTNTGMFFPAADTIAFAEGGTETMRLDSSGNVQIGTTDGGIRLRVREDSTSTTDVKGMCLQNGSFTTNTQVGIGFINGDNFNAKIYSFRSGSSAGNIVFATNGGGGTAESNVTERMRITSGGDLLVGTTNTDPTINRVNGVAIGGSAAFNIRTATNVNFWGLNATSGNHIRFYTDNGAAVAAGIISSNGTATTYGTGSDYRMKENIAPMTGALEKVIQLKPVTYTWKPQFAGTNQNGQGFIAHELQAIVPDCVTGTKDEVDAEGNPVYQNVDTSFLVATLTAAIQELKAELDATKAEVQALKEGKQ